MEKSIEIKLCFHNNKNRKKSRKKRSDLRHELNRVFDLAYIYIIYTQAEERGTIYLI